MKKFILAAFGLACIVLPAMGQQAKPVPVMQNRVLLHSAATTSHYVQWTWTAPSGPIAAAGYNFYQATGACGSTGQSFVLLVNGTTLTGWQQTTVPTTVTCSYVTAVSAVGVEGSPSASFQLDLTPPGAPGPPTPAYH